jgi:hypothetical protein
MIIQSCIEPRFIHHCSWLFLRTLVLGCSHWTQHGLDSAGTARGLMVWVIEEACQACYSGLVKVVYPGPASVPRKRGVHSMQSSNMTYALCLSARWNGTWITSLIFVLFVLLPLLRFLGSISLELLKHKTFWSNVLHWEALALRKLSKDDDFGTYSDMSAATHCCLRRNHNHLLRCAFFLAVVPRRCLRCCLRCFLFSLFVLLRAFATSSMRICIHGDYVVAHVALSHATPSRRLCIFVTDALWKREAMSRHEWHFCRRSNDING